MKVRRILLCLVFLENTFALAFVLAWFAQYTLGKLFILCWMAVSVVMVVRALRGRGR